MKQEVLTEEQDGVEEENVTRPKIIKGENSKLYFGVNPQEFGPDSHFTRHYQGKNYMIFISSQIGIDYIINFLMTISLQNFQF